jgi:hypothetical protein
MISHPNEMVWNSGPLPDAKDVPDHSTILVWIAHLSDGYLMQLGLVRPERSTGIDAQMPYYPRWLLGGMPLGAYLNEFAQGKATLVAEVKYWAWIHNA